jgi:cyclic-di-GMP-binding protein
MNNAYPLLLKLPERTPAPPESFFLDLKEVEAWASSLPIANTGESSKQIFKALVEFNRIEIQNIQRIKIIKIFRPLVEYVTSSLKKYYLDSPLPLPAKNHKVVILCRELHSELATSYKIIIEKMVSNHYEKFKQKLIIISLHQAMHYLSKVLYYSTIVYNPYPEETWREIHHLFLFAEQNNVAKIQIGDNSGNIGATSSIEDIYKRIILLALASPFQLRQQETAHLYQKLPDWAEHIRLSTPQSQGENEGHFFIRTESDDPPIHISLQTNELNNRCRLVDAQQLIQHLRSELKSIFSENTQGAIFTKKMQVTAPLLRKVINSLTYEPKRGFSRTKLHFELDIAIGISAVHSHITSNKINNDAGVNEHQGEKSNDDETDLKDSSFLDSYFSAGDDSLQIVPLDHPVDEVVLYPKDSPDTVIRDDGAPAWTTQILEKDSSTFSCKTFNESAGGYCINWTGDDPPKIRVGELIGVQSASDRSQFSIGIARWLKHMPGVGLQMGLEIISPASVAILAHIVGDKHHGPSSHKCILLPKLTVSNRPACLIMPVMNIQVGEQIQIDDDVRKRPAKLVRLLESTGTFNQFEYTYLDVDDNRVNSG